MSKMNPWLLGIFLAALGLLAPMLRAEESFSDVTPALSAASGTVGEITEKKTARGEAAPQEAVHKKTTSQEVAAEVATPGVDSAVVAAQQEVRDPFATTSDTVVSANAPAVSAQPAGPAIKVELQGIGFGSKDAYAIFGGEVFFTGDEKNGIKLVEVRRREVDIIVNGGPMTCLLFPDQELKNAKEREKRKRAVSSPSVDLKSGSPSSMPRRE